MSCLIHVGCAVLAMTVFLSSAQKLDVTGDNVCQIQKTMKYTYSTERHVGFEEYDKICEHNGRPYNCTGYRRLYGIVYRLAYRMEPDTECCEGWQRSHPNDTQCSQPVCRYTCVHGRCMIDQYGAKSCDCDLGYYGSACHAECPNGRFGSGCQGVCNCPVDSVCNRVDGSCICKHGLTGTGCDIPCDSTHYGPNCSQTCDCKNGASCDRFHGNCVCGPGWIGPRCDQPCQSGFYGDRCDSRCRCYNNAPCDPIDGACQCTAGWMGTYCTAPCPEGRYGADCKYVCQCSQHATCDRYDGCQCHTGWMGTHCNETCQRGYYGDGCVNKCNCPHGVPCDPVNGACTECPDGSYGYQCKQVCECQNNAKCDSIDGSCDCPAGWTGRSCDVRCDEMHYGPNCESTCICQNGGICDAVDGRCTCMPGWKGEDCASRCAIGYYGRGCSKKCRCRKLTMCDPVSGKCKCDPGYRGRRCNKPCKTGYYGDCRQRCNCQNNGTCNHVTGCVCAPGWIGDNCDNKCPPGYYGDQCQTLCDCKHGGHCHHIEGCQCLPGWKGPDCSDPCNHGYHGEGCNHICPSTCSENGACDHVTGTCLSCPAGLTGSLCDSSCPEGFYGPGCNEICSCVVNHLCDPVTGVCIVSSTFLSTQSVTQSVEEGLSEVRTKNEFTEVRPRSEFSEVRPRSESYRTTMITQVEKSKSNQTATFRSSGITQLSKKTDKITERQSERKTLFRTTPSQVILSSTIKESEREESTTRMHSETILTSPTVAKLTKTSLQSTAHVGISTTDMTSLPGSSSNIISNMVSPKLAIPSYSVSHRNDDVSTTTISTNNFDDVDIDQSAEETSDTRNMRGTVQPIHNKASAYVTNSPPHYSRMITADTLTNQTIEYISATQLDFKMRTKPETFTAIGFGTDVGQLASKSNKNVRMHTDNPNDDTNENLDSTDMIKILSTKLDSTTDIADLGNSTDTTKISSTKLDSITDIADLDSTDTTKISSTKLDSITDIADLDSTDMTNISSTKLDSITDIADFNSNDTTKILSTESGSIADIDDLDSKDMTMMISSTESHILDKTGNDHTLGFHNENVDQSRSVSESVSSRAPTIFDGFDESSGWQTGTDDMDISTSGDSDSFIKTISQNRPSSVSMVETTLVTRNAIVTMDTKQLIRDSNKVSNSYKSDALILSILVSVLVFLVIVVVVFVYLLFQKDIISKWRHERNGSCSSSRKSVVLETSPGNHGNNDREDLARNFVETSFSTFLSPVGQHSCSAQDGDDIMCICCGDDDSVSGIGVTSATNYNHPHYATTASSVDSGVGHEERNNAPSIFVGDINAESAHAPAPKPFKQSDL
uniref:Multiple epidermal growth factor-like domains protein 11-like n=1 Tax=Saccoglossus kowalevskii TaxID=10224 RepID=A0ABM0M1I2_SACKO|nr:PREDICTED: multiple epidermal growth factor-like domains protein 11-like [Saccoglossus kowalevskii]